MRSLRLTVGFTVILCAGVGAQESAPARPIAETAERIARQLWPTDVYRQVDDQGRPRFRTSVTVNEFALPLPWQDIDPDRARFRPRGGNLHHHQIVEQVTPEQFRAGVLYPAGIAIDPGAMYDGLRSAWRSWRERRVRERIAKEVEALRIHTSGPPD